MFRLIGKDMTHQSPEEKIVLDQILQILIFEYNNKFDKPEDIKDNQEVKAANDDLYEEIDNDESYTPEEKLDYCYPTRSYSISPDTGNYSVNL
jgi:hypothetical protein